jgi:palmitoyltransferase
MFFFDSRGETSIEAHINKRQQKRFKKKGLVYKNPYDFGVLGNWKRFFGLDNRRTFWRHVLLPSIHDPRGDGLTWEHVKHRIPYSRDKGLQLL